MDAQSAHPYSLSCARELAEIEIVAAPPSSPPPPLPPTPPRSILPFLAIRLPSHHGASLVHHVVGEERDRPEHLTSHIFRRWSVFARSFSSRKRATRWSVGALEDRAGQDKALPPPLLKQDGRVVFAYHSDGRRVFDLSRCEDIAALLLVLSIDVSVDGVRLVPAVLSASGSSPGPKVDGPRGGTKRPLPPTAPARAGDVTVVLASGRRRRVAWTNAESGVRSTCGLGGVIGGVPQLPEDVLGGLSPPGRRLCSALVGGRSVFLTGAPGCGKTHVVREVKAALTKLGVCVAACGSSGAAASLVDGVTAHSWAGFRNGDRDVYTPLSTVLKHVIPDSAKERMAQAVMLIIDEVSSLSAEFICRLDEVLRAVRGRPAAFGGLVVLFSGDFLQVCPPRGRFAFQAAVWKQTLGRHAMVLTTHYRHVNDPLYLNLLLRMRVGTHTSSDMELLATRRVTNTTAPPDCAWVYCLTKDVLKRNMEEMDKLVGSAEVFMATDATVADYLTDTQATHLLNNGTKYMQRLVLRVGAQVSVPTNVLASKGVTAGTRGIVEGFVWEGRRRCVSVRFFRRLGGWERILVGRVQSRVVAFDGVCLAATRIQFPLVLAWASTVHGSQGWTLDLMTADLSNAFAAGQVVSALSRTRSLTDTFLLGFDEDKIIVDPEALEYQTSLVSNV